MTHIACVNPHHQQAPRQTEAVAAHGESIAWYRQGESSELPALQAKQHRSMPARAGYALSLMARVTVGISACWMSCVDSGMASLRASFNRLRRLRASEPRQVRGRHQSTSASDTGVPDFDAIVSPIPTSECPRADFGRRVNCRSISPRRTRQGRRPAGRATATSGCRLVACIGSGPPESQRNRAARTPAGTERSRNTS